MIALSAFLLLGGCSTIKGWWPWGGDKHAELNAGARDNRRAPMANTESMQGGSMGQNEMAGAPSSQFQGASQSSTSDGSFFSGWFSGPSSQESVAYQARKRPIENNQQGDEMMAGSPYDATYSEAAPVMEMEAPKTLQAPTKNSGFPELASVPEVPDNVAAYQERRNASSLSMQEMDETRRDAEARRQALMDEAMMTAQTSEQMTAQDSMPASLPGSEQSEMEHTAPMDTMGTPPKSLSASRDTIPPPPPITESAMSAEVMPVTMSNEEVPYAPRGGVMEPIRLKPPAAIKKTRFLPESRYAAIRRMPTSAAADTDPFSY